MKLKKCAFCLSKIDYLEHSIRPSPFEVANNTTDRIVIFGGSTTETEILSSSVSAANFAGFFQVVPALRHHCQQNCASYRKNVSSRIKYKRAGCFVGYVEELYLFNNINSTEKKKRYTLDTDVCDRQVRLCCYKSERPCR